MPSRPCPASCWRSPSSASSAPRSASSSIAIALVAWTGPARIARAEVLSIRERDYVAGARVIGMRPLEIAFREILPNALPPVLALSAVIVAAAILTEAALSFLGLGDPNRVTWGGMIAEGRTVLRSAPFLSIFPGIALVLTVLGVYLAGEGVGRGGGREAEPVVTAAAVDPRPRRPLSPRRARPPRSTASASISPPASGSP